MSSKRAPKSPKSPTGYDRELDPATKDAPYPSTFWRLHPDDYCVLGRLDQRSLTEAIGGRILVASPGGGWDVISEDDLRQLLLIPGNSL
jgi:hypothetical protein